MMFEFVDNKLLIFMEELYRFWRYRVLKLLIYIVYGQNKEGSSPTELSSGAK